ncbi:MAG: ABC transporter permease [Candidatus Altiarchaeota archaeon]
MNINLEKTSAFIKKGFLMDVSYKTNFLFMFTGTIVRVFVFYFIGRMLSGSALPYLSQYGGDYFAFVLIGIAFTRYAWTSVNALSGIIRDEQMMGTLEVMLSAPTRFSTIVVYSTIWRFIYTSIEVAVCIGIGFFLLGFSFQGADVFAVLAMIFLTVSSLIGLGMIAAGVTVIIKKGNPMGQVFSMFSDLLSGVYFPVAVLPVWLERVSSVIPLTYSLRGLRLVILKGYSLRQVLPEVYALIAFSVILIPAGLLFLDYSVRKAKTEGNLTEY